MQKIFIGIDISSRTLDICVKSGHDVQHSVIENKQQSIKKFFEQISGEVIVAMENTGRYNWHLYQALSHFSFGIYVISPLQLKMSMGITRGKNDRIDALRICNYIERHQQDCKPWTPSAPAIANLKILLTERSWKIKQKNALLSQQKDYKLVPDVELRRELVKINNRGLANVKLEINSIELLIKKLINNNHELKKREKQIQTVPGVGPVTCWMLLAKTENFTSITEPRKMACYAGVAPFDFQSGTSVKRKPGVSRFADKSLKTVLHLAAMSAIRLKNSLGDYYRRKVKQGKNKMSVINAVRNKIIHIVFALVKNQTVYKNDLILS